MRNLGPGPEFPVLLAVLLFISVAVWPIGYSAAESTATQNEKSNSDESKSKISVKNYRSVDYADEATADKAAAYKSGTDFLGDEDDLYLSQGDPSASDNYEGDGYGYDDDEYDHFSYKRFDGDKTKFERSKKEKMEENKPMPSGDKGMKVEEPEATTIELLSFQAKNLNPTTENEPSSKVKAFSLKKNQCPEKSSEKESLSEEKIKNKSGAQEKSVDAIREKNMGKAKNAEGKESEGKELGEKQTDKGKMSSSRTNSQSNIQNFNAKEGSASLSVDKSDAKIMGKELKQGEEKIQPEEKDNFRMRGEKEEEEEEEELDGGRGVGTKGEQQPFEKNPSRLMENSGGSESKDRFVNMNDPVITDDEKISEDSGMNLARLRENRNELPYQYPNGYRYQKKKDAGRRVTYVKDVTGKITKEPFHLEFPVAADTDNNMVDHRRNFVKALKRFRSSDDSARLLDQGDTPSPYADEGKKYLASKVIEEEQRKRRSRLRRLRPNPILMKKRRWGEEQEETEEEEEDPEYELRSPYRSRINCGMFRRNIFADRNNHPGKNYFRRGNFPDDDYFDEENERNAKMKRDGDVSFFADKRKNQGKNGWTGGETVQKKKLKDINLNDDSNLFTSPLVLLRRNNKGQQAMKTFVDVRQKTDQEIDSEELARLLSRDSNYVVLKKVPVTSNVTDSVRPISEIDEPRKEKNKPSQIKLPLNGNIDNVEQERPFEEVEPVNSDNNKVTGKTKADRPVKGKDNRIDDLTDFFKINSQEDKDLDEKKEVVMSIENRLNLYTGGESNKKLFSEPILSQTNGQTREMDEQESANDRAVTIMKLSDKKGEKLANGESNLEKLMKYFKKDEKEYLITNKPCFRNDQTANMNANSVPNVVHNNEMANLGTGSTAQVFPNGMMLPPGSNAIQDNANPNAKTYQEIDLSKSTQKVPDGNRNYFLYGPDNMGSSTVHEVKASQGSFNLPPNSPYNCNPQNFNSQNYNRFPPMKNTQGGRAQSFGVSGAIQEFYPAIQPFGTGQQQCMANDFQPVDIITGRGYKRQVKNEESSGSLERFMRDFQDFSRATNPDAFTPADLPEMTLQELSAQGNENLRKLNSLLKEIISNKAEQKVDESSRIKSSKRGMFQKNKEQKNVHASGGGSGDVKARNGKWSGLSNDASTRLPNSEDTNSKLKEGKLEGKNPPPMLNKGNLNSGRSKRQARFDYKESTRALEQKVSDGPYQLIPEHLPPGMVEDRDQLRRMKSPSKACLHLPPEKLMDLVSFFNSERENTEDVSRECLCKRSAPLEEIKRHSHRRSFRSLRDETGNIKAKCVRKSFVNYLDPLVKRMEEYDARTKEERIRRRKAKREIELDESMPNDFQNFLMTSLGELENQKRDVVKKDEAIWDAEEKPEESVLGKRDTSASVKNEKKSIAKEDATSIRIKIVDGNGDVKASSEEDGLTKEVKNADMEKNEKDNRIQEVYLITNGDSNRRKKKKYASIRSDQSAQKPSILNRPPQEETVYNPNPGNGKAQMKKVMREDKENHFEGNCAHALPGYNGSSAIENDLIRNGILRENINMFTYQPKEDDLPRPVHFEKSQPSLEFETITSKIISKPQSIVSRMVDGYNTYGSPEIIYKDEIPSQYVKTSDVRPFYRFLPDGRLFRTGPENFDRFGKEYDGDGPFPYMGINRKFEDWNPDRFANREQHKFRAEGNLDPKMVEIWNEYAKTHLTPETHKEAMQREFQSAFIRTDPGNIYPLRWGTDFNFSPRDFDQAQRARTRETLTKRLAGEIPHTSQPIPIGQRMFYTFKTEVPDEEYYSIYQDPSNYRNNVKVRLMKHHESGVGSAFNSDNRQESRVKRSNEGARSKKEKRLSSGHLTESHYRKYHKKNLNVKCEGGEEEEKRERGKRDTFSDFLNADMMRRIEEEKNVRSKVKGLTSELEPNGIPFFGCATTGAEDTGIPHLPLRTLDEEKKEKMMKQYLIDQLQQQQKQQQNQLGSLNSGYPVIYKTFEIKRGRRAEAIPFPTNGKEQMESYRDRGYLKSVNPRKVKKYSDEGFEHLTPDTRFSLKSSFSPEESKAFDEPFRVPLDDKEGSSKEGNTRTGTKKSELTNGKPGSKSNSQQKYQKVAHCFSHEAPLLTAENPTDPIKIFGPLKDTLLPSKEDPNLRKHSDDNIIKIVQDKTNKELTSRHKLPFVNAVLVLTKREEPKQRNSASREDGKKHSRRMDKRRADWPKYEGRSSPYRPIGQSPQIVNEDVECRSGGCQIPIKTNMKISPNCKQLRFGKCHCERNGCDNEVENPEDEILESIRGRVESNPQFRHVIAPGLRIRWRKCERPVDPRCRKCFRQLSNRNIFLQQVRKVLARFVCDIETLAAQDFNSKFCCRPDPMSARFLEELLAVHYASTDPQATCSRQNYLSVLKEPGGNPAFAPKAETQENRREMVQKLLDEYQSLPDNERRSVEALGQYLNHELDTLNRGVNLAEGSEHEKKEERANFALTQNEFRNSGDEFPDKFTNIGKQDGKHPHLAIPAINGVHEVEKVPIRATVEVPPLPEQEHAEVTKDGYEQRQSTEMLSTETPKTEIISVKFESTTVSFRPVEKTTSPGTAKLGGLDKLGYGDIAGLQQSFKNHGPWLSNLNLGKGKSWHLPMNQSPLSRYSPGEDNHSSKESVATDNDYGLEYQEYNDYDVNQEAKRLNR